MEVLATLDTQFPRFSQDFRTYMTIIHPLRSCRGSYAKEEIYPLGRHVLYISRALNGRIESVKKNHLLQRPAKSRGEKRGKRQSSIKINLANNNNPIAYDIIAVSC